VSRLAFVAEQGSTPTPDPTILTTEALTRGLQAERDYTDGVRAVIEERLRGIDIATQLLNETVNRVPSALTEGLGHLQAVMDERFLSIEKQFAERDTRSERESRDNKVAVDAAFAAQKEAAAKQEETFGRSIDKSEGTTNETIKGLTKTVDELKLLVNTIASAKLGASQTNAGLATVVGLVLTAAIIGVALFAALHK
jgi:hypothetical protein